ncbi:PC-esterase domain-containing protein 1B [Lemmus lemmus]
MDQVLPKSCLLVWNTAMPLGDKIKAAFLPQKCKGQYRISVATLKKRVSQANFYSHAEATKRCFDVLDLNFHFRQAKRHLQGDGVHWNEHAHRRLSYLLLAHMADAWGVDLPHRDPWEPGPVGDFSFYPQPPVPNFRPPCYQRQAPVVHRGFPRYLAHGPYMPWRERPRRPQRHAPACLESRPQ